MTVRRSWFRLPIAMLALACALLVLTAGIAVAAPGDLDTFFSRDGQKFVDFSGRNDFAYTVALQSGRILVAGISGFSTGENFALARMHGDGSLDKSFGTRGRVRTNVGVRADEFSNGLAVLSSGKIVVAGDSRIASGTKLSLVRYRADGSLDPTFGGGDGKVLQGVAPGDAFGYDLG